MSAPGDEAVSTREEHASLKGKATSGVAWTLSQQWAIRMTGFVTIAILTRLLTPADFGIVALAIAIIPILQLAADMGFHTYLVQADRPTSRTFSTAFWYCGSIALVLSGMLVVVAPTVGTALNTPEIVPVLRVLALSVPITMLGAVPMALMRRRMRFRELAVQAVLAGIVGQAIAVFLALNGHGVWALVWQTLSAQTVGTTLVWISARWWPTLAFSWAEVGVMLRFGVKVAGSELVSISRVWLENLIIVAALGTTGLGYLSIAQRLVQIAHDLTTNALAPVSMVIFAQIRHSGDRLRSAYLRAQSSAHALVVPVMVFIAVGGPLIFPLLFGDQWDASILPGQILAIAGIFTLSGMDKGLLVGLGRPGAWLVWVLVVDGVTVLVTYFAASLGLTAITLGFLGVAVSATAWRWVIVSRVISMPWQVVATPLLRVSVPATCSAGMGLAVVHASGVLPSPLALMLAGLAIAAVYFPLTRWLSPVAWGELTGLAGSAVGRIASARRITSETGDRGEDDPRRELG